MLVDERGEPSVKAAVRPRFRDWKKNELLKVQSWCARLAVNRCSYGSGCLHVRQKLLTFHGIIGQSADRRVFLGFAPARVLHAISFADVLNEDTGRGYQRRLNQQHSFDFRKYIQQDGSATIPLTLNARPCADDAWRLTTTASGAKLEIRADAGRILTQVDCQHRLGTLHDVDTQLPFMCFLGLTEREEMEIFSVINSKAKGLSTSLLDYHAATLATNLAAERPELLIALHLNADPSSPWHRQLDLGGTTTSGLQRRASLRTMQKAVKHFLTQTKLSKTKDIEVVATTVLAFWSAVAQVLESAWSEPRRHLVNKGVGVYALMVIGGDLVQEAETLASCDKRYFRAKLSEFLPAVDWSTDGAFRGLGGEVGVKEAVALLRSARKKTRMKVVRRG
ncbi:MAG TPA: DGQHR domain-containing protein [Thermoanaerobaculia bacterium]|nr:DGQHR domain-containing protein [Thermoanaerobaculia bacterium]